MELLSKTRVINRLLQRAEGMRVEYADLTSALRDMIAANVFLIDSKGDLLTHALAETFDYVQVPVSVGDSDALTNDLAMRLLWSERTMINQREVTPFCAEGTRFDNNEAYVTVVPVHGHGERLGTLLITKHGNGLSDEDVVLAEYSATVVGLEMMRTQSERRLQEGRDRSIVQMAVGSLSYSELEAVEHIFAELTGREGLLVASRIADRAGITRSVIVNALRKLESAGVVEARSLGMKGTHIRILNEKLLPMLADLKSR